MINIENGYIENDEGELRQLWFDEAVKQGYAPYAGNSIDWFDRDNCYVLSTQQEMSTGNDATNNIYIEGKVQLTLKDFELVPEVDPYAELKAAHAEGKTIEIFGTISKRWVEASDLNPPILWNGMLENYRIKPEPVFKPTIGKMCNVYFVGDTNPVTEKCVPIRISETGSILWFEDAGDVSYPNDITKDSDVVFSVIVDAPVNKPHVHAELIHAWAEGAEIQYQNIGSDTWFSAKSPSWSAQVQYRIKPTEKDTTEIQTQIDSLLNSKLISLKSVIEAREDIKFINVKLDELKKQL